MSKCLSSSRNFSSLAACFALSGFFFFEAFIASEFYAVNRAQASYCTS
jgi:hypothetical protein